MRSTPTQENRKKKKKKQHRVGEGVRWKIPLGNTGRRSSWEREACVRAYVCVCV